MKPQLECRLRGGNQFHSSSSKTFISAFEYVNLEQKGLMRAIIQNLGRPLFFHLFQLNATFILLLSILHL